MTDEASDGHGDWMTDLQNASRGMHRLDFDLDSGEMGAAATTETGVEVPCPDCGFVNHLWVLVRQRECTECGRAMEVYIDYGEEANPDR